MTETRIRSNDQIISRMFLRLMPAQIILMAMNFANGIVSSLFAGNYLGKAEMTAVGLYSPIAQLITAISTMMVAGSQILCGKYMGKNHLEHTQDIFSLDLSFCSLIALVLTGLTVLASLTGQTGFLTSEPAVQEALKVYLLGTAIGILPMMLGAQLASFLSIELQMKRTIFASAAFIAVNILLNFVFLGVLKMNAFGLALASSIGCWIYFFIQGQYYLTGKSQLKFRRGGAIWNDLKDITWIGLPGAISPAYQSVRLFIINGLLTRYVGSIGVSAFTVVNSLTAIFWSVPIGISAVTRMLASVAVGEEDRQSIRDIMKFTLARCTPAMVVYAAAAILLAGPFTRFYYRDPSDPIYAMVLWGFRLIPVAYPLGHICLQVNAYAQSVGKTLLTHIESFVDGVFAPALFAFLLVPSMGIIGVYAAVILNGIATVIVPYVYSVIVNRKLPRTLDQLLMIPEEFGALERDRLDFSVDSMEEVVAVSEKVHDFCTAHGIDSRRTYFSSLFLEEMAGNVIQHGFSRDRGPHSVDIRVVKKEDDMILRIKDDCIPFNPKERAEIADPADPVKNIGIRMVYLIAREMTYQNMMGLNVLTIRI